MSHVLYTYHSPRFSPCTLLLVLEIDISSTTHNSCLASSIAKLPRSSCKGSTWGIVFLPKSMIVTHADRLLGGMSHQNTKVLYPETS